MKFIFILCFSFFNFFSANFTSKAAEKINIKFEEMSIPISIDELSRLDKLNQDSTEIIEWFRNNGLEKIFQLSKYLKFPIFKQDGFSKQVLRSWIGKKILSELSNTFIVPNDINGIQVFNTIEKLLEQKKEVSTIDILKTIPAKEIQLDVDNLIKIITSWKKALEEQQTYTKKLKFLDNKEENISLNQGSPKLLTLARLEKRKGHALILKSIMNLKKYFPDIQYIIAGEGDELDSIKNKIKEYNLQDHVNLVGTVNENQKNYIFSNTDLMIMPTLDESSAKSIEGFGIAYIEAANFKIPSIASNIGGTPEAVIHNKTGLIIKDIDELDEAIKSLIDNKENRLKLGQNAKIRAENELNWDIQIKKYNDLIKEIQ